MLLAALGAGGGLGCSDGQLDAFSRQSEVVTEGGGLGSGGKPGTGGTTGVSGGAGGSAGTTSAGGSDANGPLLIDDFEDGNNETIVPGGWWYVQGDGSGSFDAAYGAATTRGANITRALRVNGSGFKSWIFAGLDLPGQPNLDASAFGYLTFSARSDAAAIERTLSVDVLDGTSVNAQDSTALHFRTQVELSNEWTVYSIALRELAPTDGEATLRANRASLAAVQFWILSAEPFDFWIDDLGFSP
jgi:hypothetical protein